MFLEQQKKPKVSQTIFEVGRDKNGKKYFKSLFVEKVVTTPLTPTPVGIEVEDKGFNEEKRGHEYTQKLVYKDVNHILVYTRCKEIIDLTSNVRACEEVGTPPLGKIFTDKRKAKHYFNSLNASLYYIFEEAHNLLSGKSA